ncbi:MAG TPA: glycosyl hydrolase [Anaerolineae bacterium]|nr:glycosyl hydrolase [Anaerolineae bacterium]
MKRLFPLWLALGFLTLLFYLLPLTRPVEAHPQPGGQDAAQAANLPAKADNQVTLANSPVFSLYLPMVSVPPLNPKKGFSAHGSPACTDLKALRASWYHNGSPFPDGTCGSEYHQNFVPMIYNKDLMVHLSTAVAQAQVSGYLIGFGEPNLTEQNSYLSPTEGATLWKQIEDAVVGTNIKLVSPAPNQFNPGQYGQQYGHQWTWAMADEFQRLYGRKPRFDATAWHIYADSASQLQNYLTARHNEAVTRGYNGPVWVLEYAGQCVTSSVPTVQSLMMATAPWLNSTPWIERYAWFATRLTPGSDAAGNDYSRCSLVDSSSGTVTSLGYTYKDY